MTLTSDLVDSGIEMYPSRRPIVMGHQEHSLFGQCLRVVVRALTNIGTHPRVFRLFKLAPFAEVARHNPKFPIKYLTDLYLARGLTVSERATCFLHHYQRLYQTLPERVLHQSLHFDVVLFEISEFEQSVSVTMGMSRPCDKEGETSLLLKVNGETVFTLSCSIIPGRIVRSDAKDVLLISRLQSMPGCYYSQQVKSATRIMRRVHPRALLIAALEGVAFALGIDEVAAVCAEDQVSYCKEYSDLFRHGYDEFWEELRMVKNGAGFFSSALPFEEKPLSSIKPNNRLGTKKRRAFKQHVRLTCTATFLKLTGQIVDAFKEVQAEDTFESHYSLELSEP